MKDFLWGAATASHQVEGGNIHNDWYAWERAGNIEGGAQSGAAADHWNRYAEDLKGAAELGLNSYRFSVEWSRIEPEEGKWDAEALAWYRNLIDECEKLELVPMLTLLHFTLPKWVADQGGITGPRFPQYFARFTEKVIDAVGSRIALWCTLNEPMVLTLGSYLGRFMPPAEFSPVKASAACVNLLRAHVLAYDLIHERVPGPVAVGIAHNMLDFMPDRIWHPIEFVLSKVFHRFYNLAWLDAVTGRSQKFYVPGLIPRAPEVREAKGRSTADFVGVNYYTKAYVQWRPRAPANERPPELPLGMAFARRSEKVSDLGWAIHPRGFEKILKCAAKYGRPIYVTENGIADRNDSLRAEYLESHLGVLERSVRNGMDVRGYYHWTLMDNFEWIKGFAPRFGLFEVNYDTFERTQRRSAKVYSKFIKRFTEALAVRHRD